MYNAFVFISDLLTGNTTITDEFPTSTNVEGPNIFAGIADSETEGDFMVYLVRRNSTFTKNGLQEYEAEISVFADSIMEAAQKADIVQTELTNHPRIYGSSADVQLTEDRTRAYINLIFTFKI